MLDTDGNAVRFQAPVSYQEGASGREGVRSRYVEQADGSIGFELGGYDHSRELVIDPILSYVAFLGGTGYDSGDSIAVDSAGNVYLTGYTRSADFPTTPGPLDGTYAGDGVTQGDMFVSKLSVDGTSLVFSTFIGGSADDRGTGIEVDGSGNIYVSGWSNSSDLPTVNAYQSSMNGAGDAVVLKLSAAGNSLLYSSYFGGGHGTSAEVTYDVALDSANNALIVGSTQSTDLPLKNGYDNTFGGIQDVFVAKFDLSQSGVNSLLYSTYFGGSDNEWANSIAVDSTGRFSIAGYTLSNDLPIVNGYDATYGSGGDAFIATFDSSGVSLLYSTYLGGTALDDVQAVAVDSTGNVYVGGRTQGGFPTTVGAFDTTMAGSNDGYIAKIDPTQNGAASLIYSTYLGGSGFDYVIGLDVDDTGVVYITGFANSADFPTTIDGADQNLTGSNDGFFATLNAAGTSLTYSTFLGGSGQDRGLDVVYSADSGAAYVTGYVGATDWPGTPTATHFGPEGGTDAFVAKFSFNQAPTITNGFAFGLPGTDEDSASPGTAVSAIVNAAGWSDADVGAVRGMAITSATGGGTWEYSTDAVSWNAFGAVSATNALLLSETTQVRYIGDGISGETASFDFRAWDTTSGAVSTNATPAYANPGVGGGSSAFSLESAVANLTVTSLNDAPVNTVPGTAATPFNTPLTFTGVDTISVDDVDAGSNPLEVTLTATNGTLTLGSTLGLSFSIGTGTADPVMAFYGTLGNINAALASASFTPTTDYSGAATVQITTTDTAGRSVGNATVFGSSTSFGSFDKKQIATQVNVATDGTVTSITAFLVNNKANTVQYGIYSDASGEPGTLLAAASTTLPKDLGGSWYSLELPSTAVSAGNYWIALDVGKEGAFFYNSTGGNTRFSNYDPFGGLSSPNWTGTYASNSQSLSVYLSFTADGDTPLGDTDTVNITVGPNTAPLLSGANNLTPIDEDPTANPGTLVSALIAGHVTDPDNGAVSGIAVTSVDNTNGTWEYSINGGGTWLAFGFPGTDTARLLAADANSLVRFVPNANWNGTVNNGITFRAWDQTSGSNGGLADTLNNGTTTAFSLATSSASLVVNAVNDAPSIGLPSGPASFAENDPPAVIDLASTLSDFDSPDFDTGTLTVDFTLGGTSNDRLAIRNQGPGNGNIAIASNAVTYDSGSGPVVIGTFAGGTNGTDPLVVTLNADADVTAVQSLMRNITFENVADDPSTTARTVRFVLTDGDGGTSTAATKVINVTAVVDHVLAVDTTSDTVDGVTTSIDALLDNRGADGFISLREAILAANNTAGGDTINFNIAGAGVHTISLTSSLPTITGQVTIDGYTQTGAMANTITTGNNAVLQIELNGAGAGAVNGLTLDAGSDGSTIRGLVINRFGLSGIQLNSANNLIVGNFVGTNNAGTSDLGNTLDGITVSANDNTIGTAAAADRNLISGNNDEPIDVDVGVTGTIIRGNYVGTNAAGTAAIANGTAGNANSGFLLIEGDNSIVGGANPGEGNLVSGSTHAGILLTGTGNTVQGNLIGTDATGTVSLANQGPGVLIGEIPGVQKGANNLIGGTTAGAGNVIAFNAGDGISLDAGAGNGNAFLRNTIWGNAGIGIDLSDNGVTPNDVTPGDGDSGPNNWQNFPLLTRASSYGGDTTITGTFNSTAGTTFRIEFFSSPTGDGTGYGEGQTYLGFVDVGTDGSGDATINALLTGVALTEGHQVTATATLLTGGVTPASTSEFAQNVTAVVNDFAPVITSDGGGATAAINVAENSSAVTMVTGTDADVPAQTLSYAISGGADAAKFAIDANSGVLTFRDAPNYESPTDSDSDNVYVVEVTANDGLGGTDLQIISVTVTDVVPVAIDDAYAVDADATLNADWWNTNWTRRQQLTFDNLAQSETLTDFPVLVVLNPGNIDYAQTQDDGSDLRFFAADGTPLAYEIEHWNEGGESSVWVRVPQIAGNSNSDSIWMYYGNAAAAPGADPSGVWDGNFVGVWHLNEEQAGTGTAGIYQDSTAFGNDGIDRVAATGQEGQVTNGQQFGANDWIEIGHDPVLDLTESMTISFWIKPTSNSGTFNRVVEKGLWGYGSSYYFGGGNGTNDLTFYLNGQEVIDTTDNVLTVGVWQHAALSYTSNGDGTGTARLYLDGVEIATGNYTNGAVPGNTGRLAIGHDDPLYDFDGYVDEVQISNIDRSADWIAAHYQATKNQFGAEFVQLGGEQVAPVVGGVSENDLPDGYQTTVTNLDTTGTLGLVTLNADGTFSYDPNGQFDNLAAGSSTTDTFTYTVTDGVTTSAAATVTITINGVNDAPTLGNGTLAAIPEDTGGPLGESVATIFMGQFSDVDAGWSFEGIAVVGNSADAGTEGTWQYSTNAGGNWFAIGTVADDATALAISSSTLIRFLPAADYSGAAASIDSAWARQHVRGRVLDDGGQRDTRQHRHHDQGRHHRDCRRHRQPVDVHHRHQRCADTDDGYGQPSECERRFGAHVAWLKRIELRSRRWRRRNQPDTDLHGYGDSRRRLGRCISGRRYDACDDGFIHLGRNPWRPVQAGGQLDRHDRVPI